jgi:hypothetical protein
MDPSESSTNTPSRQVSGEDPTFLPSQEFLDYLVKAEDNRKLELENGDRDSERAYQFSVSMIKQDSENRQHRDGTLLAKSKQTWIAAIIIVFLGVLFICTMALMGKDAIAMEVIKIAGTAIVSGFGAYNLGKSRGQHPGSDGTGQ